MSEPHKEETPKYSIEQAAKRLGRKFCGRVPHVVGVSLLRKDSHVPGFELYVDIDDDEADKRIPEEFDGYVVHVRRVGTPRASAEMEVATQPPLPFEKQNLSESYNQPQWASKEKIRRERKDNRVVPQ